MNVTFGEGTNFARGMKCKRMSKLSTVRSVHIKVAHSSNSGETRMELDSHADTCVLGKGCLKVFDWNRPVNVSGWNPKDGERLCQTISGAVAYDHPQTGQLYLFIFHQCIHVDHLDHHLMCPMQCRMNDVEINETPKFLVKHPTDSSHAIVVDEPDGIAPLIVPLSINGVTSFFTCRKPTRSEYDDDGVPRINFTAEAPDWDPSDCEYAQREEATMDFRGTVVDGETTERGPSMVISQVSLGVDAIDISSDDNFGLALEGNINVSNEFDAAATNEMETKHKIMRVGTSNSKRSLAINHDMVQDRWGIHPSVAKNTVERTTQRGVRISCPHPSLMKRMRTNDRMLRYKRLPCNVFADTLISGTVSKRGNKYAEIFATDFGWARAYPMKRKGEAHEALSLLFQRTGVPDNLIVDGSKEQVQGDFKKKCSEAGCRLKQTEPYSPWQNAAEGSIRELKRGAGRKMTKSGSPKKLWDHCLELEGLIRSHTALDIYKLNGEVPETVMTGDTADISIIAEHAWYEWIKFYDPVGKTFPEDKTYLGRYLGPAIDIGPALTAKILKSNGEVVYRSTYRSLTPQEMNDEEESRREFDKKIEEKLGPKAVADDFEDMNMEETPVFEKYEDDEVEGTPDEPLEELEPTPDLSTDVYLNASIVLPRGDKLARGKVVRRKRDVDGNPIGRENQNPILDTRRYDVEFEDGEETELTANVIAERMYAQCDGNGNDLLLLDSFVDYRKSERAMSLQDQQLTVNGKACMKRSTAGWEICVLWKDESTTWEKLSDLKECYPVETAEYAVLQKLDHEPAFNWWVKHVLRKRDRIISKVKQRGAKKYAKTTMKFGIECPKTVEEALALDSKNGNTLWADAITKEMKNVRVAFNIGEKGDSPPVGHQFIKCHMIFDVKMEDLRRKARMVAGGHMTDVPPTITYASVVSRETVRIALMMAALHDLNVKTADIMNAYIKAPCAEKVYTILGPEFGPDEGKMAVIVRALYGLKSAGASFRNHLADCMKQMGYRSCLADPDLWMKPMTRKGDGLEYYEYILLYVDDVLAIGEDPENVLKKVDKYFGLKPGSMADPSIYLGAKVKQMRMPNGVMAWSLSPSQYVQEAVKNTEIYVKEKLGERWSLPKMAKNPFPTGYEPPLDVSPELDPELSSYYQSLIGMLRWMVEIGRIDINTEVSMLASHLALPREGHLEAVFHIFSYLRAKHNSRLALDPTYPEIDESSFKKHEWVSFYGDVKEAVPQDMPKPRGKSVDLRMYVDSDHAGDKSTRRSRTGFLIYMNMALIQWLSKKQPTIETSVFGAEFVAMKHGMETLRGLRYKLRMMGVPIEGPSYIYGDNMSVIHNTQRPESTLKKKSNSICYHAMRESVAMGESLTGHVPTDENPSDLLTKVLTGRKREYHVSNILYDIYDEHH